MLNHALLNSKYDVNDFTENLVKLIEKSNDGVGYMVRTRDGAVINTCDMYLQYDLNGKPYFQRNDKSVSWFPNGSCQHNNLSTKGDYALTDIVSSEQA